MTTEHLRVRFSRSNGELEIEGDPKSVREWWDELSPSLVGAGGGRPVLQGGPAGSRPQSFTAESVDGEIPDTFGEFFHRYRPEISDVDKMLVAAYYAQATGGTRTFTTRTASELLVDQGVKLSNPSMAVRRLAATKKIFTVTPGVFRVSDPGVRYLSGLRNLSE